jgi:hypothetical protein
VLNAVKAANLNFFLAIGDLSYGDVSPESAWCQFVKSRVGSSFRSNWWQGITKTTVPTD